MNTTYPYLLTENSLLVLKGNNRLVANKNHPNFQKIIDRIKAKNFNNIEQLFKIKDTVERLFNVTVKNGREVFYKGKRVNNVLSDKIVSFICQGLPHKPLVKFMNHLYENPSEEARESLYDYLTQNVLPITDTGYFIGYKTIRADNGRDFYSNSVDNKVGSVVSIDRDKVAKDRQECAGSGLHLGSINYIKTYGDNTNKAYIMIEVNPRDVVIVPNEGIYQKIRVCKYKVLSRVSADKLNFESDFAGKNENYKEYKRGIRRNRLGQFC